MTEPLAVVFKIADGMVVIANAVDVAFEVVALPMVTLPSVEEPVTKRLAKYPCVARKKVLNSEVVVAFVPVALVKLRLCSVFDPEKVLLSARRVVEAPVPEPPPIQVPAIA